MDSIDLDAEDLFGDDDEDDIEAALIKEDARADSDADADAADGQRDAGPEEDEELDVAVLRALDPSRTRGGARKRTASTRSRNLLDPVRLLGPRGLRSLLESARRVSVGTGSTAAELKLRGVGHEAADLVALLRHIELWGHRLYPKANMDELTERLEWLGAKREVRTLLRKMRLGEEDDDAIFNMQLGPAVLTAENAASASGDQKPPPLPPPPQQQMSYGGADSNDDIGELLRKADQDESQFLLETDENELPAASTIPAAAAAALSGLTGWERAEASRLAALERRRQRQKKVAEVDSTETVAETIEEDACRDDSFVY